MSRHVNAFVSRRIVDIYFYAFAAENLLNIGNICSHARKRGFVIYTNLSL